VAARYGKRDQKQKDKVTGQDVAHSISSKRNNSAGAKSLHKCSFSPLMQTLHQHCFRSEKSERPL
jgi:hypothetical protein